MTFAKPETLCLVFFILHLVKVMLNSLELVHLFVLKAVKLFLLTLDIALETVTASTSFASNV